MKVKDRLRLIGTWLALPLLSGCSSPIGAESSLEPTGLRARDPSNARSSVLMDPDNVVLSGGGTTETSIVGEEQLRETNTGGASKQRLSVRLPVSVAGTRETIVSQLSAAANLEAKGLTIVFSESGAPLRAELESLRTDNAAVELAVGQRVAEEVRAYLAGTEAERAVQLTRLETQRAAIGEAGATARAALPILSALVGVPPIK